MTYLTNLVRSKGDPKIIKSGPSSLPASDRMARNLGWFSIALGVTGLVAASSVTRLLGMRGREGLVRSFGLREIASGVLQGYYTPIFSDIARHLDVRDADVNWFESNQDSGLIHT